MVTEASSQAIKPLAGLRLACPTLSGRSLPSPRPKLPPARQGRQYRRGPTRPIGCAFCQGQGSRRAPCCPSAHRPTRSASWPILDKMTKREVVDAVALKTERAKTDVEMVLDSVLEVIVGALHANERVDLRGFGSFTVKAKSARQGRNPRTGETITIAAKRDASFKASTDLSKTLNADPTPTEVSSSH